MKTCNTCSKVLPEEAFVPRLKKGGIWGTTAKCRSCMNAAHRYNREIRRIVKLAQEKGLTVIRA